MYRGKLRNTALIIHSTIHARTTVHEPKRPTALPNHLQVFHHCDFLRAEICAATRAAHVRTKHADYHCLSLSSKSSRCSGMNGNASLNMATNHGPGRQREAAPRARRYPRRKRKQLSTGSRGGTSVPGGKRPGNWSISGALARGGARDTLSAV